MMKASLSKESASSSRDSELSAQFSQVSVPQQPPLQNRASKSSSPYVRDQASSPVAWQLFDNEAVQRAKSDNKLIFLSVGFKSCHCESGPNYLPSCQLCERNRLC